MIYPAKASCLAAFFFGFSQREQTQSLTPEQTTVLTDQKQKTGSSIKPSQLGQSRLEAERENQTRPPDEVIKSILQS